MTNAAWKVNFATKWARLQSQLIWLGTHWPKYSKNWKSPTMLVYYWWLERFTSVGRTMVVLLFFTLSLAFFPGRDYSEYVALFVYFWVFFSWIVSTKPVKHVQVQVQYPYTWQAQSTHTIVVKLTNTSPKPRVLGAGVYRMHESLQFAEPPGQYAACMPGKTVVLCIPVKAQRRGKYSIYGITVFEPSALGIARKRLFYKQPQVITVYPQLSQSVAGDVPHALQDGLQQGTMHAVPAGDLDFAGLREYMPGDSIRSIHHRAWAKQNKPYTRKYQKPADSGLKLYLDIPYLSWWNRYQWEPFLQKACALGLALMQQYGVTTARVGASELSGHTVEHVQGAWLEAIGALPLMGLGKTPTLGARWAQLEQQSHYPVVVLSCGPLSNDRNNHILQMRAKGMNILVWECVC
jgi:uncharacterized protein (DUF58 family)